jgi:hypothetical protein
MHDWIVGLRKAAIEGRLGVGDERIAALEAEAGFSLPSELKEMYREMDGGRFPGGVVLYSVRPAGGIPGLLSKSVAAKQTKHSPKTWHFGEHGPLKQILALPKKELARRAGRNPIPPWASALPEEGWGFAVQSPQEVSLFQSLEQLLASLVPPASTEVIGENTFHRALSAVEGAVDAMHREKNSTSQKTPAKKSKT